MERQRIWKGLLWALATGAAVGIIIVIIWVLPSVLTREPTIPKSADRHKAIADTRTGLVALLAAIGAAGGLTYTARTFRQNKRDQDRTYRLNLAAYVAESYTKAIERLAHDQAPVRLTAFFDLERLAQEDPPRRQIVVDVICAYLRVPYTSPVPDKRHLEPVASSTEAAKQQDRAIEERQRDAAQEPQVRRIAQGLLAKHLRTPPGTSGEDAQRIKASPEEPFWPGISLDLSGAELVELNLRAISAVDATFDGATFHRVAVFDKAYFSGSASFDRATFPDGAWFSEAAFSKDAWFSDAKFGGETWFRNAKFSGSAAFRNAQFGTNASFRGVQFSSHGAWFSGATFPDKSVSFREVKFLGGAWFDNATFPGEALFDRATFSGEVGLAGAHVLNLEPNQSGEHVHRVWPDGWTVKPDEAEPRHGTLVPPVVNADSRKG